MKKNLLIALALPAMFAACSQEDVISNGQLQNGLSGTPAGEISFVLGEGVDSRLEWGTVDGPDWSAEDAFSLFWVGATGENKDGNGIYSSATNALYQSEGGSEFTSKNIVYVGKHIIVYPADYAHVTNKKIEVKVGEEQKADEGLGNRSILVSDLLDIQARPEKESDRKDDVMYAGYAEPVNAEVAALSSNMVLNLNFKMNENINEVKIKSVVLESNNEIFAYSGNLKTDANGYTTLVPTATGKTMTLVMPEGTKVTKSSPTYTAQIALLPPVADKLTDATYKIVVNTNFGYVTIDKAMLVTNSAGKYQVKEGTGYDATFAETIDEKTGLSFNTEFGDVAVRKADNKATEEDESETSYGKRFARNVAVDMATAEISGMKIADSQDLIDAYQVYDLLGKGKEDKVSFILEGQAWKDGAEKYTFDLNPAAAVAVAEHEYVTLDLGEKCDTLALVNETTAFASVPDLSKALGDNRAKLHLNLCEGNWALNVKDAKLVNAYKEIHNLGSLTITETAVTNGVALNKVVCNEGTTTFSGTTVNMPVAYNQTEAGNTIVGAETKVNLNAGGTISGEADIKGKFAANKGLVNIAADAKIKVSGSILTASTGTMNNLGTITLEGLGTAIVSANQDAATMGSIILADRMSMAKVNDSEKQGYIKWIYNENGVFYKNLTDAFNCLVLESNIKFDQNLVGANVKHIEIASAKVSVLPFYTDASDKILSLNLSSVLVGENCTLVVPVGTSIETGATVKNGDIEVYGTYVAGTETGNGTIYYFNEQVNVASEAALLDAVKAKNGVKKVVLEKDIELTNTLKIAKELVIDLNGKTLEAGVFGENSDGTYNTVDNDNSYAIYIVDGADVTINGEGEIIAQDLTGDEVYSMAVYATGGKLTINGGTYRNGAIDSDLIYASGDAVIEINGGEFYANGNTYSQPGTQNAYTAINLKGGSMAKCVVKGGTFRNFNPYCNESEGANTNFVAEGYTVEAWNVTNNVAAGKDNWLKAYNKTWTNTVDYTVVPVPASED